MKNLTLKQHWMIATCLMAAGVIVATLEMLANGIADVNWWIQGAACVLAFGGYFYFLKFVRCPECGARLRSTTKFPEKCEVCGEDLRKYNK